MSFFTQDFFIHYSDIDSHNQLTLSSLFNLFQEIGCLHSDVAGYGLKQATVTHYVWIVMGWKASIYRRPSWNEKLHMLTWSRGSDGIYAYREYEVYDSQNVLVATACSKWVLFNILTNHMEKITDTVLQPFTIEEKTNFPGPFLKLKEPENSTLTFSYSVLQRDIDTNGHMNNNHYLQLALDALPSSVDSSAFSSVEILYKHEAKLGDTLSCLYTFSEDKTHILTIKSEDRSQLHAIVKFN